MSDNGISPFGLGRRQPLGQDKIGRGQVPSVFVATTSEIALKATFTAGGEPATLVVADSYCGRASYSEQILWQPGIS